MWNLSKAFQRLRERLVAHRFAGGGGEDARRYRLLFENAMDALLLTTPDGEIVMANKACTDMFGYSEQELRALGRSAIVDETDPRLPAALEERARQGWFRGDLTMKRKDGTRIEAEVCSVIFRGAGRSQLTSMLIRNVTERKAQDATRDRLLRALDAERRWLRGVVQQVPLGLLLFDAEGRITFNAAIEKILGMSLSPEGGRAQYVDRIRFPDGRPVGPEDLLSSRVLSSGKAVPPTEFVVVHEDGSRIPVLASAAPIRDDDGKVVGGVGVFQDLTEHKRGEEAISANERLLDGIFEILPVGVWIADANAHIVRGNPAGVRIWAGARYVEPSQFGEYRGWWADTGKLIQPDEWALARALQKGETSIGEVIRIQCFDGTYKTIINSALPLYDRAGKFAGAIAVNEDITLLKEIEANLHRAVASRDRVLSIVAHDLRSPLSVIRLKLYGLMHANERRRDHLEAFQVILNQAISMERLIQDLLDVTRIEQGKLLLERARVSCEALLQEVLSAHQSLADLHSLTIRCDIEPGISEICVDRGRMVQVLNNLIGNAVKFTPPGGSITVGAGRRIGGALLWVADTGIGMEPGVLEHIFDSLWQQAAADRRGVGLGLAIAKAIVEAHGGRIWARSSVGEGTTFFFTVPDTTAEGQSVPPDGERDAETERTGTSTGPTAAGDVAPGAEARAPEGVASADIALESRQQRLA